MILARAPLQDRNVVLYERLRVIARGVRGLRLWCRTPASWWNLRRARASQSKLCLVRSDSLDGYWPARFHASRRRRAFDCRGRMPRVQQWRRL